MTMVMTFYAWNSCSDGGGRSGVYLEVDANLELLEEDGLLDVFGYLKKLRNSRKGMVETLVNLFFTSIPMCISKHLFFWTIYLTSNPMLSLSFYKEQMKFMYDTLEEYVICRKTWFPVSELSQRLKHKSMKDPQTKINEYQREFLVRIFQWNTGSCWLIGHLFTNFYLSQLICKQTPRFSIGDCAGGHRADNRDKNRDVLVIPRKYKPYSLFPFIRTRKSE